MSQSTLNLIESLYEATGGSTAEIGRNSSVLCKGYVLVRDGGEYWGVMRLMNPEQSMLDERDLRIDVSKTTGKLFTFFDSASNNIFARESGEKVGNIIPVTGAFRSAGSYFFGVDNYRDAQLVFRQVKGYVEQALEYHCR